MFAFSLEKETKIHFNDDDYAIRWDVLNWSVFGLSIRHDNGVIESNNNDCRDVVDGDDDDDQTDDGCAVDWLEIGL